MLRFHYNFYGKLLTIWYHWGCKYFYFFVKDKTSAVCIKSSRKWWWWWWWCTIGEFILFCLRSNFSLQILMQCQVDKGGIERSKLSQWIWFDVKPNSQGNITGNTRWFGFISWVNVYYTHFEITGGPCNLIGSNWCDLFTNHIIFCFKLHLFCGQWGGYT